MPLSLDLVLDRLQGLQSELQREKAARAKLQPSSEDGAAYAK